MRVKSSHCVGLHFRQESTCSNNSSATLCCHKGKVPFSNLRISPYFQELNENSQSENRAARLKYRHYLDNIVQFNAAFAMVISETHLDETIFTRFPLQDYLYKIHDTSYHRVGLLIPQEGRDSQYSQIYMFDVDTATHQRMKQTGNKKML